MGSHRVRHRLVTKQQQQNTIVRVTYKQQTFFSQFWRNVNGLAGILPGPFTAQRELLTMVSKASIGLTAQYPFLSLPHTTVPMSRLPSLPPQSAPQTLSVGLGLYHTMSFTSEPMTAPDSPDPLLVSTFPLVCPAGVSRFTRSRPNSRPPPRSALPSVFVGSANSSSTTQPSISEPSWPFTFCLTSHVTWYEVLPLPSTHIQSLIVFHHLLLSGNFTKLLFVKMKLGSSLLLVGFVSLPQAGATL